MSEIANGWSWYKFDIDGWLSSVDVQKMDFTEKGIYHHLLTIQARDGKLAADVLQLSKQVGADRRVIQRWIKKWGHLFPTVAIEFDVNVTPALRPCSIHAASALLTCSMCAAPALPLRCFPAAYWMRTRCFRVNPKLWNLQVNSGKFAGQPLLEEKREEGVLEGDEGEDKTGVLLTLKSKPLTPAVKAEGA